MYDMNRDHIRTDVAALLHATTGILQSIEVPVVLHVACIDTLKAKHLARSSTMLTLFSFEPLGSLKLPGDDSALLPFFSFFPGVGA